MVASSAGTGRRGRVPPDSAAFPHADPVILHIGTSGWQYRPWRGPFYPEKLAQKNWLGYYSRHFPIVEVNSTFYRLPEPATLAGWVEQTPPGFVMALKASRYLTHVRRLRDPEEPVKRLLDRAGRLGAKLGPVLLQLPPNLPLDLDALDRALGCFPDAMRVAVELRHDSWFVRDTWDLLGARGAAFCLADRVGPETPVQATSGWTYLRMHQGRKSSPSYGRAALDAWIGRLADNWPADGEAYVFFNNDEECSSVRDSRAFARLAEGRGLEVRALTAEGS